MAAYHQLRDALRDQIVAVVGAKPVHARPRFSSRWDAFLDLFTALAGGRRRVDGWWVQLERREDAYHSQGTINQRWEFALVGLRGFQDEADTDRDFGDEVGAVMDAVGGMAISGAWEVGPPLLRAYQLRQFGSVLCHYAEVAVVVEQEATL